MHSGCNAQMRQISCKISRLGPGSYWRAQDSSYDDDDDDDAMLCYINLRSKAGLVYRTGGTFDF